MYLVEALASLRDQDMNIRIDGFYERVVEPTEADREMMAKIDPEIDQRRKLVGFDRLIRDPMPEHVIEQLLFTPTCNIAGITTGYQRPGSKTVLPAEATAKLDFRLIPDQDPGDILARLRKHFDAHGFEKVEILSHDGEKPARSDPKSDVARSDRLCEGASWRPGPVAVHASHGPNASRGVRPGRADRAARRGRPAGQPHPRAKRKHPCRRLPQYRPPDVPGLGTLRRRID
jgi:acetylornithine deacetylase/succinyl-diaminopimelate desuccinylase-like protein